MAVCSESHTNVLCEQNLELLNVKHAGKYLNHKAFKNCVFSTHTHTHILASVNVWKILAKFLNERDMLWQLGTDGTRVLLVGTNTVQGSIFDSHGSGQCSVAGPCVSVLNIIISHMVANIYTKLINPKNKNIHSILTSAYILGSTLNSARYQASTKTDVKTKPHCTFFKWSQLGAHCFSVYLFQLLYMFRATMCPSSGELTVSLQHLVLVAVWSAGWDDSHPNQQTRQPPIQSEKYQCRIDTVDSPDDGHIVARNM